MKEHVLYSNYLVRHRLKQNRGSLGQRDSEMTKTYRAEWVAQADMRMMDLYPTFSDIKEAQRFTKKVCRSKTWAKLYEENRASKPTSELPVRLKMSGDGRGTAGFTNGRRIVLDPHTGMNVYVLLHEMAHCLGHMHHGRSFRRDLLKLVSRFMGRPQANALKNAFKAHKLPCGDARKPLTFEQWKAARDRMVNARKKMLDC
jgi:hypothetical protein